MRARRASSIALAIGATMLAVATFGGCAFHRPAPPPGWVPRYGDAQGHRGGRGAWGVFEVRREARSTFEHRRGAPPTRAEGELIAFEADSVYLLAPDGLIVLPTDGVARATFAPYHWPGGAMEMVRVSSSRPARMRSFARFPGGLPAGVDPRALLREP